MTDITLLLPQSNTWDYLTVAKQMINDNLKKLCLIEIHETI